MVSICAFCSSEVLQQQLEAILKTLRPNVRGTSLNSVIIEDAAVFAVDLGAGNCALETKEAKASAAGRT